MVSELVELSAVIGDIYDAAGDPKLWQQALGRICAYVGGASAALLTHDKATRRSRVLHLFNENAYFTRLYLERLPAAHPVFPGAFRLDAGDIGTIDDVLPRPTFIETPFYKEWAEPQGIVDALLVKLATDEKSASLMDIPTRAVPDEGMRNRLGVLVPHLQRAVTGRSFDRGKSNHQTLQALAQLYRLTATEVQVLNALSTVRGVKEMADTLGLSENTVKFHLRNMFRKTGTTRQADLMRLVISV